MTKLDLILEKIEGLNEKLFIGKNSLQDRISVMEESVRNCQRNSLDRVDGSMKMRLAIFSAMVTAVFAAVIAWFKD